MLGQHDCNVCIPLTTCQEERSAALFGPAFNVGIAGDQQLSQLKEPFLCRQSEWTLPGWEREGGERTYMITLLMSSLYHPSLHPPLSILSPHLLLGKGVEGLQP